MTDLAGRTVVVTGGGRGIGRSIALALGARGASVALLARTASEIEKVGREIEARTGEPSAGRARTAAIPCDVTRASSIKEAVAAAERDLGPIDILVNAAGDAVAAPLEKTDDALWAHLLLVNLTGTFLMIRETAPGMIARRRGRIVNIASVAGLGGAPYVAAYTAAKHGVIGLTRALALELAKHGITVNAVCPGYVDTPLTDRSVASIVERTGMSESETRALLAARSPQNRLIDPDEVAASVVYLVSDGARGVNGQTIVINGGGAPA